MISFARIDDRLIHGQVVTGWTRTKGIDYILAVDDKTSADKLQCRMMKLATPAGAQAEIMSVAQAIETITSGKLDKKHVFIITKGPQEILSLMAAGIDFGKDINVGNHRYPTGVTLAPYVITTEDLIPSWKELSSKAKLYGQLTPDAVVYDVDEALKKL